MMDLTAEYYLQTVDTVFVRHALPNGDDDPSRPAGRSGQDPQRARCSPSRASTTTFPASARPRPRISSASTFRPEHKMHYLQLGVGHYGVFNGSRFRSEVAPRIADFILSIQTPAKARVGSPRRAPLQACKSRDSSARHSGMALDSARSLRERPAMICERVQSHAQNCRDCCLPDCPNVAARACSIAVRANRRRSRSSSTRRSIRCASAATARRAAIRCASMPRPARSSSPCRRAAASARPRSSPRSTAAGSRRGCAACRRRRRSPTARCCRCAASSIASCTGRACAARSGPRLGEDGEPLLCVAGDAPHIDRRVGDFLRREALRDLEAASRRAAEQLGVAIKRISVRDQSSRWGSCSTTGVLSYSWRLILAPPFVLDYLAVHEVAHLIEMNHSPRFWRLVNAHLPRRQPRQGLARRPRHRPAPLRHADGASRSRSR